MVLSLRRSLVARTSLVAIAAVAATLAGPLALPADAVGPTIDTVAPNKSANSNAAQSVTFSGYTSLATPDTATLTGPATIIGSITSASTSQTTATFDLSGKPAGSYAVSLSTGAVAQASCNAPCFVIDAAPTVTSVAPSAALNNGSKSLTLTGTGFANGATFKLAHAGQSDIVATGVNVASATSLSGTVALAAAAPYSDWSVVVANTDTGTGTCACTFNVTAAASPAPTAANPADLGQGATPSTTVTITGTGFAKGAAVQFSDANVQAGSATVSSATSLTVPVTVLAAATPGASPFTVTNVDGQNGSCAACFTVDAAPTVGAPSPANAGQGAANRNITIAGTGFRANAGVAFSGSGVTTGTVVVNSATSITVPVSVTAGATTGTRDITVTNADGSHATAANAFTIDAAPAGVVVAPSSRSQGTSGSEDITGTSFVNGATVSVSGGGGGVTVSNVAFSSATKLTATFTVAPGATAGARTVTVTNPDGGAGTGAFTVGNAPTITSVTPSTGGQGATGRSIAIKGTNFTPTSTVAFNGSGINPGTVSYVDASNLTVPVDISGAAPVTARDVTVTNPSDGGTVTSLGAFSVTAAPTPSGLAPSALGQGATAATVVVNGSGFVAGMTASFAGTGVSVDDVNVDSATQATLHVTVTGSATLGGHALTLTNTDGGTTSGVASLTIDAAPTVASATPSHAQQGATVSVTITGSGFVSGATVSVEGTGVTASSPNVASATSITATFTISGGAATTNRKVSVTNPDKGVGTTVSGAFQVDPSPAISSVSPPSVSNGGSPHSRPIAFTGSGFTTGSTTMKLTLAGQPDVVATSATASSSTGASGTFVIEALKPGSWSPVLVNPDGSTATCTCYLTVLGDVPTVSSITPNALGQGASAVSVGVVGTNFSNGATLTFGGTGVSAANVVVVDAKHITADITVTAVAAPGARDVIVTNADSSSGSLPGGLTIDVSPAVTSITPSVRAQGTSTDNVAIAGTGFVTGMTLDLGPGVTVSNLVVSNATTATATVAVTSNAAPGARAATPTNADHGTTSTPSSFTVDVAPTVTTATPALGQGASAQTVTVTGTGFVSGAVVTFAKASSTGTVTAGSATVAGNGNSLTVPVTVSSTATTGGWDVTVTNPDAGTATASGAFTVDAKPTVTSVSPSTAGRGFSGAGSVTGTGFVTGMTVTFDATGVTFTVSNVTGTSATGTLTVSASATLGTHAATVTNTDGGTDTKASALTVTAAPVITSFTPSTRAQGTSTDNVAIAGTGFATGMTISLGSGVTVSNIAVTSGTTATATIAVASNATTGARDANPTNSDGGTSTTTNAFAVGNGPTVSTATPALPQGAVAKTVTVNGTGFVTGAVVTFAKASSTGTVAAGTATVAADGKSLTVPVTVSSDATTGAWNVTVTNTDSGTATGVGGFTVDAKPTVTGISPGTVGRGTSGPGTVTGTGFASGMTVTFDGTGVTFTVAAVTATTATGTLTASASATAGAHALTVTNTDGGTATKAAALTVTAAPTVTSVTPALVAGTSSTVTVKGSGFTGTPTVTLPSGITGGTVTLVDDTTLKLPVDVTADVAAGSYSITVKNADGGTAQCATCITVFGHTVMSLTATPNAIIAGQAARLAGVLRDATHGPLAGRIVTLYVVAGTTVTMVSQAGTTATGTFSFAVTPKHDTTYAVGYAGDGGQSPAYAGTPVSVAWRVTVVKAVTGKHTTTGAMFNVTISSSPNAAGATAVLLERLANGKYVTRATVTVGSTGTAKLSVALKTGSHALIARIRKHGTNERGSSSPISVRIR